MNKKVISFIICLILLVSISCCALAKTDPSKIMPDTYYGSVVIIGDTYHEPNHMVINYDPKTETVILYPVYIPEDTVETTNDNNI